MDYAAESLKKHYEWKGKLEMTPRAAVDNKEALSLAYTPGVAQPCLEIQKDVNKSYELTRRWNTVAVVTDGTAVLGLGDIGPEAGMPVMEGKCVLFKAFGGVDAVPLCVRSKNVDDIVNTVTMLAGSFGGVNLEDISAPRCFEIEKQLKERCDIPVFHDDQHGTAVITLAGLLNALKLVGKKIEDVKIVTSGAGGHDFHVFDLLADKLERIEKTGQRDHGCAVLVIVEHRNIAALFELLFNLKASGCGDILQVHAAERACQHCDSIDNIVNIFAAHAKRDCVHAAECLEEHALALHDRHTGFRTDIAEAENRRAVGHDSHCVPAAGQFIALVDVLLDLQAGLGNAGRVRQRQRFLIVHRRAGGHFELALPLIVLL